LEVDDDRAATPWTNVDVEMRSNRSQLKTRSLTAISWRRRSSATSAVGNRAAQHQVGVSSPP
jgi:hypothetical protein